MNIKAFKMDGLGNDFVIIDNRQKITNLNKEQIIKICDRSFIGCDQLILIENDKMNIKQYKDVEQPFNLPNGLDLFSWSLPFLADKIGEMMDHLLKKNEVVPKEKIKLAK